MLKGKNITFSYSDSAKGKIQILKDISFHINKGDFIGVIGASGSGKTTFIKHLNGLLKADCGEIFFEGQNIYEKKYPLSQLRKEVGLVFQYPEQQLFGRTVLKDTMYGPLNLGMSEQDAKKSAIDSLELVGITEEYYQMSPIELSGGQKRCVAIAGVLAMQPKILVLDEPTAGLDPEGRDKILQCISDLREKRGIGVVLVSHSMEDVANYADRIIVMNGGEVMYDDVPHKVFAHYRKLEKVGLAAPQITYVMHELKKAGYNVDENIINLEEAKENILKCLGR